ncbi:MAG: PFL_4695 family integrating conjugative element protein [Steroidobacteraceae bacterium]
MALAAPTVIYDAGAEASQPMDTYVHMVTTGKRFQIPKDAKAISHLQQKLAERMQASGGKRFVRVPIRTSNMLPARFESKDAYFANLISPIFIVGADPNSLQWLRVWRDTLARVGAIGWVVQAENAQDLRAIADAGHGLRMMTMSGESIPGVFGVATYPVLISSRSIEQ